MRLAFWALAFVFGVLAGMTGGRVLSIFAALVGFTACALLMRRRWWTTACAGLALALGVGHGFRQQSIASEREQAVNSQQPGGQVCVVGQITDCAAPVDEAQRFRVAGQLEPPVHGREAMAVRLSVLLARTEDPPVAEVHEGDRVRVCGVWQPPFGFFNPGSSGWPQVALKGDFGSLRSTSLAMVHAAPWWSPWASAAWVRRVLSAAFSGIPEARAAFLRATVLGERSAVAPEIENGFKAAGATHALSVSGLHLAAVAALFFVGLRWLLLLWPWGAVVLPVVPLAAALSIPAVVFYTMVTGDAVATWRSAVMACCMFGGYVLRRSPAMAASIAAAGTLIVLQSAYWLYDISFQLSLISVMALALFAGTLTFNPAGGQRLFKWLQGWIAKGMAATLAAGLLTAPLVAYHFSELTPAAPLGNLTLTPLVEVLIVPLGLLGACAAAVFPAASAVALWPADVASLVTMHVAVWFGKFAPVWRVNPPSALGTVAIMLGIACALRAVTRTGMARRKWALLALSFWALAAGLWTLRRWQTTHRVGVRVTFLDVGQGDAGVIEGPGGFVAVVDAGGLSSSFDTGARLVVPFLRRTGVDHIDLVVLSHPHPDHALGLFAVLQNFEVKQLWMPADAQGPAHDGDFIRRLRQLAQARGAAVPEPKSFASGSMLIEPLGPWDGVRIAAPQGLSVNDASLSVKFSFAGRSVLFAGDLEAPGEFELAERAGEGFVDPRSDILKVPHHGSKTSSSVALLKAVAPSVAVISAGRGNRFGFPHEEVMGRYQERNIRLLRTDSQGAVQIEWAQDRKSGGALLPLLARCERGVDAVCIGF